MKYLPWAAALALLMLFGLPFRPYDTRTLLPVETVQLAAAEEGVVLVTEAGTGRGTDLAAAVADLRQRATGRVFFDTAEALILCAGVNAEEIVHSGLLRPGVAVYRAAEVQKVEGLAAWVAVNKSDCTVAELRAEE